MYAKSAEADKRAVAERLAAADSLIIVTHIHPDGDALGSMVALARAARSAGKTAHTVLTDEVPLRYQFLAEEESPLDAKQFERVADEVDEIVVVDTCAFAQLGNVAEQLRLHRENVLVIDHHETSDDIGSLKWVEQGASAVGVMIGELLGELGWAVDLTTAEALATAALSDTGWLRFSNTDGRCLRAVAQWFDLGVRPDRLYRRIYQADRPERLRLLIRMLEAMELRADGQLAAAVLRNNDFQLSGAMEHETEDLVNEPMRLESVEVSVLVIETEDGSRVSLRSREYVDVSAVARQFGGGGHARAAGLRMSEPPDAVAAKLFNACEQAIAQSA
ncbi:MAG: DHH family phosphoesterase [Planctomycetota bacterium]